MSNQEIWLEKYRPSSVSDIKGHETITSTLQKYIDDNNIPNLIFSGPPGVGKTVSAVSLAKDFYENDWRKNFIELNASDSRGIDDVRNEIKNFARTATKYPYRIIFLDEADALTDDAQSALRRTIEKNSNNARFIFSCNYPSQIIEPIQSRCHVYRFTPLEETAIEKQIKEIVHNEHISITDHSIKTIARTADGDMRNAINTLHAVSTMSNEKITKDDIYMISNTVPREKIRKIFEQCENGEFMNARNNVRQIIQEKGVSEQQIIKQMYEEVFEIQTKQNEEDIIKEISKVEKNISQGANGRIQIDGLLARLSDQ